MVTVLKAFWTIKEVAEYLSESHYTIYDWVARKKIPYYKRGRNLRFNINEIQEWDESNHQAARCERN